LREENENRRISGWLEVHVILFVEEYSVVDFVVECFVDFD